MFSIIDKVALLLIINVYFFNVYFIKGDDN